MWIVPQQYDHYDYGHTAQAYGKDPSKLPVITTQNAMKHTLV